jgi:acetoin utilization deacetylase AcuC-like enzyme
MDLTETTYRKIGQRIASLEIPAVFILEGAYRANMGESITALLEGYGN